VAKRLDWASAFDLDGDGQFDDALNPGALLPTPADLTIDFASSLQLRLTGTLTGTGVVGTNVDAIPDNAILTLGPLQVTGTAGFALTMSSVDADLDGNGTADLIGATLTGLALDVTNAGVNITGVATLTVSGQLALAMLKPAVNVVTPDTRSWFGLKMGDVTVAGALDPSLGIQLSATIAIGSFDYNSASSTNPAQVAKRLDWASAFDLDCDGQFDDALNPGALLPTPADLTIDFASSLQLRLTGTLTGTGVVGTNVDAIPDNAILTLGPLQVTGTAGFALTIELGGCGPRWQRHGRSDWRDAHGPGAGCDERRGEHHRGGDADGVGAVGPGDAQARGECGDPGYAQLVRAEDGGCDGGGGAGSVAGDSALGDDRDRVVRLQQRLLDQPAQVAKRLDWASAFDLDGDGQFDDALNPGALLPTPADLTIDFASSLQLRLTGTLTGTGVVGTNVDAIPDNAILTLGPLQVTGTAGFALTMSSVDADLDGNGTADLIGATLTGLALDVTNAGVNITGVATLTVSGQLALAMLKPAVNVVTPDTRSWFGLKMGGCDGGGGAGSVAGDSALGDDRDRVVRLQQRLLDQPRAGGQAAGLGERVRSGWRRAVR